MYVDSTSTTNPLTTAATASAKASANKTITSKDALSGFGGDDFMLLLLAQLQNQNPLEPMKNEEFMNQITQLNSLNELQSIDTSMKSLSSTSALGNAVGLIGKKVNLENGESDTVTGVAMDGENVLLQLSTQQVPLSNVVSVGV